jgi:hypothetical protein
MVPSPSCLQTFAIVRDEERGRRREACPEEPFQLMSLLMEAISPLMLAISILICVSGHCCHQCLTSIVIVAAALTPITITGL